MNQGMFLTALLSYFVIVDPIGVALVFAALTDGKEDSYCRKMAFRAVLLSSIIILCFGFFGEALLSKLGIAIESFRIAGGLLLFYTAFNMITKSEVFSFEGSSKGPEDISVFPLSFPLIAGPGCLTLTVLLHADAGQRAENVIALVLAVLLVVALTFFCFLSAHKISHFMGETGNNIVKRLLGVLLASLSIQFIADGIMGFLG
ncbi:MAG: MarC family protein [Desulfobulbaceae bacterium]|nr:MarC family protein [Desulfobulbaceae bacterium]